MNALKNLTHFVIAMTITGAFAQASAAPLDSSTIVSIGDGERAAQRAIVDSESTHRAPNGIAAASVELAGNERAARCAIVAADCEARSERDRATVDGARSTATLADGERAAQRAIAEPTPYRHAGSTVVIRAASAR